MLRSNSEENSEDYLVYSPIQIAAKNNSFEEIKYLIENRKCEDFGPDTALHISLRQENTEIANYLLEYGDYLLEQIDSYGDKPIHIACDLGLTQIVKKLCLLGCTLESPNAHHHGFYPLHLAAKNGHLEIVRILCAAGCNIDARNSDNIRADITALKHGHNDIAEFLDRIKHSGHRDNYVRQLVPTTKPLVHLTLRLLGHSGVGKSSLVKSLNAGLFTSLFRRSSSTRSNTSSRPSSPITAQIEMNVTTTTTTTTSSSLSSSSSSRQNSLTFDTPIHRHSTKGIHVQKVDISNVGEISIWDFSGQENYFPIYHHFLYPSAYAVTAILFNLNDPPNVQIQQVRFWLNFLMARQKADLPSNEYGPIILVATHADLTRATRNSHGEYSSLDAQKTLETIQNLVPHAPNLIKDNVIIMDTNIPASHPIKHQFRSLLHSIHLTCLQNAQITWTGLLEHTLTWINKLKSDYEAFPVISKELFTELVQNNVNLFASFEHIDALLDQLQILGEVFTVKNTSVILSNSWLGTQLLGELFSNHFIQNAREIGVYTAEDFQSSYTECAASEVLQLLESLDLCVQCDVDGEIEYEFPIYIQTEELDDLWDDSVNNRTDDAYLYGGLRFYASTGILCMFKSVFPHIQVHLRRYLTMIYCDEADLFQWRFGSKVSSNDDLEALITFDEDEQENHRQYIEIKIRGPSNSSYACLGFLENIKRCVRKTFQKVIPGLLLEMHLLSTEELKLYANNPYCYSPQTVTRSIMETESIFDIILFNPNTNNHETLSQLIMFDDIELVKNLHWGCSLSIQELPGPVKFRLAHFLDPPERHGRDWCLLALKLGICQKKITNLNSSHSSFTMRLLSIAECTIGALIANLHELDLDEAAELILNSAPIYKVSFDHH